MALVRGRPMNLAAWLSLAFGALLAFAVFICIIGG